MIVTSDMVIPWNWEGGCTWPWQHRHFQNVPCDIMVSPHPPPPPLPPTQSMALDLGLPYYYQSATGRRVEQPWSYGDPFVVWPSTGHILDGPLDKAAGMYAYSTGPGHWRCTGREGRTSCVCPLYSPDGRPAAHVYTYMYVHSGWTLTLQAPSSEHPIWTLSIHFF